MKNVLLYSVLFSALFFFQSCGNTTTHPDLRLFHLKGKVKSLKYRVSSTKDATSCVGIGMGKEYTPYYVYEFSKEGEWINPKNDIERNSEGFIIKAGLHEFEWDDKGRLQNRRINDIYGSPIPEDYIAYYYNNDNIVDSLQHNDGGEYGYIHRYYRYLYKDSEGKNDKYDNWRYADMQVVFEADYKIKDAFAITREIEYWTDDELNEGKKKGSSKNLTDAFNETIKNRFLFFRFPFNGSCYKSLLFYPITETKGHAYLLDFDPDMKSCSSNFSYRFSYTISNDEIFITNGRSLSKNLYGEYNRHEDTVLKITSNGSKNIELDVMPSGPKCVEYIWRTNIDDFWKRVLN